MNEKNNDSHAFMGSKEEVSYKLLAVWSTQWVEGEGKFPFLFSLLILASFTGALQSWLANTRSTGEKQTSSLTQTLCTHRGVLSGEQLEVVV